MYVRQIFQIKKGAGTTLNISATDADVPVEDFRRLRQEVLAGLQREGQIDLDNVFSDIGPAPPETKLLFFSSSSRPMENLLPEFL